MAFKRSAVRSRLTPPLKLFLSFNHFFLILLKSHYKGILMFSDDFQFVLCYNRC